MDISSLLDRLELSDFVTIQLITSGLDPHKHSIQKITCIHFKNGQTFKEWSSPIDKDNGIKDVLLDFKEFIKSYPIVMHNNKFCLDFLNYYLKIKDQSIEFGPDYDTLSLSKVLIYNNEDFSLDVVAKYYKINNSNAQIGLLFIELIKDLASLSLDLLNDIVGIAKAKKINNKKLFFDLKQLLLINKKFNGLYKNRIFVDMNSLEYKSSGNSDINTLKPYNKILSKNGLLNEKWSEFEEREDQINFYNDVHLSLEDNKVFLGEAGTGLGKTIAYLLAAILYSIKNNTTVVISTYTKYLQDQIFYKDLPLLTEILNIEFDSLLLKGRNNYICKTRLFALMQNFNLVLNDKESESLLAILIWNYYTESGEISECRSFNINQNIKIWNLVKSEAIYCSSGKCHKWGGCYRKSMTDYLNKVNILVVNHSLLLSNLKSNEIEKLPRFKYVLDEGHHLVSVSHDILSKQISIHSIDKIGQFFDQKSIALNTEFLNIINKNNEIESILSEIQIEAPLVIHLYIDFFNNYLGKNRTINDNTKHIIEDSELEFEGIDFEYLLRSLKTLNSKIKVFSNKIYEYDANNNVTTELIILLDEFYDNIEVLDRIVSNSNEDICWSYFRQNSVVTFHCAPRDISNFLSNYIFNERCRGAICSATLQFNNSFDYFIEELGLNDLDNINIKTSVYKSPFLYNEQMQLFLFKTKLDINSQDYTDSLASQIFLYRKKINTRILVLCTSYSQIISFKNYFNKQNIDDNIFYQLPNSNRSFLIQKYLKEKNSILFGTSSFWEGIDLPGKDVETLWITKIPFSNPKDPLFISQSEKYTSKGKNSFIFYSLPDATIKLKQGFGRLIRNLNDSGVCILSDPRLSNKKYGKVILDSLPMHSILYSDINDVIFKTTHFLEEFK